MSWGAGGWKRGGHARSAPALPPASPGAGVYLPDSEFPGMMTGVSQTKCT